MKQFKIRASSGSVLLTEPRTKKDKEAGVLAKTVQTYLNDWIKEQLYGRKKEFTNKYTSKGTKVEGDSLRWVADRVGLGMVLDTNGEYLENDYFTGTPDLVIGDYVIDLKNSWSYDTFPLFQEGIPKNYEVQLQIYMALTGKKKAKLIYCLMNTPEEIVEKEIYYTIKDMQKTAKLSDQDVADLEAEIRAFHNYDNVPDELRFKVYETEYSEEFIKILKEKVTNAQLYINEKIQTIYV